MSVLDFAWSGNCVGAHYEGWFILIFAWCFVGLFSSFGLAFKLW